MSRIFRARINPRFTDVCVSPLRHGARLDVGGLRIPLTETQALALADALTDATEETPA